MANESQTVHDLEAEIGSKSLAACEYYSQVHDRVKALVSEIKSDSKSRDSFGREFMVLTLDEKKVDAGIAYRRLDIKSQYVTAYISANTGEPGEFRASVCYDTSGRKPKSLTWYFPKEGAPSPEELADKVVRSIVLPNDDPFA